MEDLEQLLRQGRFREAFEQSRGSSDPRTLLIHARVALDLGQVPYSQEVLQQAGPFTDPALESERLAALGWVYQALGNPDTHFELAQQAAQTHRGFYSLFSLASSLLPQQAFPVLKEVLAHASNAREESQAAVALARTLELLGRFREGYTYASLAYLRTPDDPVVVIAYATLALAGNDRVALDDLANLLEPIATGGEYIYRLQALNLLADIYLLLGQPQKALEMVEQNLQMVTKDHLVLVCLVAVRIYLVLGKRDRALMLVRAAQPSTSAYSRLQGSLQLALGLVLYPSSEAQPAFEEAIRYLGDGFPPGTLIARLYLLDISGEPPPNDLLKQLDEWSEYALSLYPPLMQTSRQRGYRLRALGDGRLEGSDGTMALRPRGLEILVLLLSKPQGWGREELCEALYGSQRIRAFKTEIHRLKEVLGDLIQPKPWRVTAQVGADFLEVKYWLNRGEVGAALAAYKGVLLPQSEAPGIEELRHELEEELRRAVMTSNNPDLLFALSSLLPDDLELLEQLVGLLPHTDWRSSVVLSRTERLRKAYGS
jgi:tetratricopeptide (TPR) repeat protein